MRINNSFKTLFPNIKTNDTDRFRSVLLFYVTPVSYSVCVLVQKRTSEHRFRWLKIERSLKECTSPAAFHDTVLRLLRTLTPAGCYSVISKWTEEGWGGSKPTFVPQSEVKTPTRSACDEVMTFGVCDHLGSNNKQIYYLQKINDDAQNLCRKLYLWINV